MEPGRKHVASPASPSRIRRGLLRAGALATALGPSIGSAQPAWPTRPVTLYLPVPPGSLIDSVSRALGTAVSAAVGQPVIIENRPGASATMPAAILATAKPDGYALGIAPATVFKLPHLQKLTWDPTRDLTYLMAFTRLVYALVVPGNSPWKTVQDFVAYAKANPGKVSLGATGAGSSGHIAIAAFSRAAGIDTTFVPFKGGTEVLQAFMGGHVTAVLDAGWPQFVRQGGGRALLAFTERRIAKLPDVPTTGERGIDVVIRSPLGLIAPKGMEPALAARIHDAFKAATADAAYRTALDSYDVEDAYMSGEDYEKLARQLFVDEKRNLEALGITSQ